MDYSTKEIMLVAVVLALTAAMLAFLVTYNVITTSFYKEAITHGYAHWEPNPGTGQNQFTWNK